MFGTMGQTNVKNLGNGGTMDGDVTITGDLTVSGGISLSLNEVLQGTSTIDINSTEALLVRKDSDGGDVFIVDTTNNDVTIGSSSLADGTLIIESNSSGDPKLQLTSTANRIGIMDFVEAGTLQGSIVYDHNGDNLKFATGSANRTARFVVNETSSHFTSNVGIGKVPSAELLELEGTSTAFMQIQSTGADSTSGISLQNDAINYVLRANGANSDSFEIRDATNNAQRLIIDSSGNVSINTTAAYGNLTVGGTGEIISGRASSGAGSFSMYEGGTGRFVLESLNGSGGLAIKVPTTEAMRIDSSGNVGIGVTPSNYFANYDNLVVGATSGHTGITVVSGNDSYGTIAFADGTSGQAEFEGEIQYRHGSDNELSLGVGGSRRMIIDSSGNTTFAGNQVIYADGNIAIPATKGLFFDGGTHTYISETSGDILKVHVANVICGTFRDSGFAIEPTSKLWFDGAGDTYIHEQSANKLDFFVGNGTRFVLDTNSRISLGNNDSSGSTTNTIFGRGAGNAIASGALGNTLIANDAGKLITTGNYNVLIGTSAGDAIVDSNNHVIIGTGAGGNGDIANDGVVAVGHVAAHAITSAQRITAIGYQALTAEDAGSYQTAVGYQALSQVNNDNGHNTALGQRAGYNLTTGNANTLIGSGADASANSGVNQTVVGQGATGQADNSVTLGNASVTAVYMAQDSGATVHCAGINFSATQSAPDAGTSSSEVLSSYEEGTWEASFTVVGSGSVTAETSNNTCWYKKIGSVVHCGGRVYVSSVSSPSGQIYITGIPFNTVDGAEGSDLSTGSVILYNPASDTTGYVGIELAVGQQGFLIREGAGLASGVVGIADHFDADTLVGFQMTYPTTI